MNTLNFMKKHNIPFSESSMDSYDDFAQNFDIYKKWTNEWVQKCIAIKKTNELLLSWVVENKNINLKTSNSNSYYTTTVQNGILKNSSNII